VIFLIEPRLYYIIDYYDIPLNGLCIYNEEVYYFSLIGDEIYGMFQLHEEDKYTLLRNKKEFENLVGAHWSFNWHTGKVEQKQYVSTGKEQEYYQKYHSSNKEDLKRHERYKAKLVGQFMEFEQWSKT
jgi:hypothetical protein